MFTHLVDRLASRVFVFAAAVICAVFAGAAPIAAQPCEETTWTDFDEQPGYGFVMTYDSARGVLVAFDGSTWESAGDGPWIKRTSAGPTMRLWVPMVYDAARGVCLLFGGDWRSDTWTWDGEAWTLVSNTGPVGRRAHAMTYDPDNNRVLLFGGQDANFAPLGDTWAWDGTSWHLLTSSGPTPRSGMSLAYDTARHRAVLYGGFTTTGESDTWEFDGTSWSRISFIGPTRTAQSMVYDTARGVTVLHGGSGSADLGDTWEWDGAVWTQVDSVGPAGSRLRAQMVFHTALDRVVMSSGDYATVSHIVVWAWDGTRWGPLWTPAPSPPLGRGPMVYDSRRERCVANISSDIGDQTWEWDGQGWELKAAGNVPVGPMVFDTFRGVSMLLSEVGETWTWNAEQWIRVATVGPGARIGAAMAFDSDRGVAVFFGGQGRTDTWEWNGESWAMSGASAPTPIARTGAAMCYDTVMHRTIMFGGYIIWNINELDDTWSWDGKSWIQLSSSTRPPPRAYTSLTFDSVRGRRVLVGGFNFEPHGNWDCFADSWESDQSPGWEQVGNRIPPGTRSSSPMAYDAARDTIVLFGGSWECTGDNHTWGRRVTRINGSPSIVVQPEDARIPLGEGVSLSVDAVGEGTLTYQWRRNGQPIERDFSTRVFGENSAILSIVDAIIQDTGSYDVVVSNACTSVTSGAAMLTITGGCPGDFNTDGTLTSQDFFDFLSAFFDLLPRADIDQSGTVDSADFFIYLEAFFAGCE